MQIRQCKGEGAKFHYDKEAVDVSLGCSHVTCASVLWVDSANSTRQEY